MRLWCDVYDATDTLLGNGPVMSILSASVTKALDGAGSGSVTFPAGDEDALTLIQNERRIRVWMEDDERVRELGRFVVRDLKISGQESSMQITASGPDSLDALTRKSVLLGRSYDYQTVSDIANSLIGLVPGWKAITYSGAYQSSRFDGTNVLKALIRCANELGLHLREGENANTVEIGAFGDDSGVTAIHPTSLSRDIYNDDSTILIDSITQSTASKDVVNWIIPLGAGEGTSALTLKNSSRSTPYAVQQVPSPDGRILYAIGDTNSIGAYGQIEKVVAFKEIAPVSNTDTAKINAANALYDAAASYLGRSKDPLTVYSISGKKCRTTIRPGDKIRVVYKGVVETAQKYLTPIDVNAVFWVMKVSESFGQDGSKISLTINSVDRPEQDTVSTVVNAIESIQAKNVSTPLVSFLSVSNDRDDCEYVTGSPTGHDATFYIDIDNTITEVAYVKIRFITIPFSTRVRVNPLYGAAGTNIGYVFNTIQGDQHPKMLQLWIDGADYSSRFGGPWNANLAGTDNNQIDVTADITDILRTAGLYGRHTIVFKAAMGGASSYPVPTYTVGSLTGQTSSGVISLRTTIFGTAQAIALS